jgi:hypothetical protein
VNPLFSGLGSSFCFLLPPPPPPIRGLRVYDLMHMVLRSIP